jgi:hypothetical protein
MPAMVNCTVVGSCPVSPLLLIALLATTCDNTIITVTSTPFGMWCWPSTNFDMYLTVSAQAGHPDQWQASLLLSPYPHCRW